MALQSTTPAAVGQQEVALAAISVGDGSAGLVPAEDRVEFGSYIAPNSTRSGVASRSSWAEQIAYGICMRFAAAR